MAALQRSTSSTKWFRGRATVRVNNVIEQSKEFRDILPSLLLAKTWVMFGVNIFAVKPNIFAPLLQAQSLGAELSSQNVSVSRKASICFGPVNGVQARCEQAWKTNDANGESDRLHCVAMAT
ncbi:uncharacterized protein J7T54_003285 [Emericellopsis cladophorae]|uniref:Uncharacterized protein n=1 Tax=Emericellopsis cladophorae TaxID=2686198 RepID=A0A9Q0BD82_9HYPO|nr:uncharacterized protein J7T54_003285 [Emericellopsis cladophorae]KAI6781117.1 hypothetical protein J7T54_003285 [Emericellopsis cladophorae]